MNVNAASAGPSGLDAALALLPLPPTAAPVPKSVEDTAIGHLHEFSAPALHSALHLPDDPAHFNAVVQQAVAALARHDAPGALHAVSELLHRQPDAGFRVFNEPALVPIHAEMRELVRNLTLEARLDAQNTVAKASHLVATRASAPEFPATLALANQFLETGQYANYVRAAELGRLVINWSTPQKGAPDGISHSLDEFVSFWGAAWTTAWRRAPVLVLLAAWLLLGAILIPLDPELWGIGFLAIVVFQFVLTLRNWPRRPGTRSEGSTDRHRLQGRVLR